MVDYAFYMNEYHGSVISAQELPVYEAKASAQLNLYKRIYTVEVPKDSSGAEEMAVCAMAEALHGFDLIANGEGGAVQSATIGSVSTSYGSSGSNAVDITPKGQARELYRLACLYLDIYRGVS